MTPGLKVKATKNYNRIKEGTPGIVIEGPKDGLRKQDEWIWVNFEGHVDPKLMKKEELEVQIDFYNF